MILYYFASSKNKSIVGKDMKYLIGLFDKTDVVEQELSRFALSGKIKLNKQKVSFDIPFDPEEDSVAVVFVKDKLDRVVVNPMLYGYLGDNLYLFCTVNPTVEQIRATIESTHDYETFDEVEEGIVYG